MLADWLIEANGKGSEAAIESSVVSAVLKMASGVAPMINVEAK